MEATTKAQPTLRIDAEVYEDARKRGLEKCMPALVDIAKRLFAQANSLKVTVEFDPEIADLSWIVFTANGISPSYEERKALRHKWYEETAAICPKHLLCDLALHMYSAE